MILTALIHADEDSFLCDNQSSQYILFNIIILILTLSFLTHSFTSARILIVHKYVLRASIYLLDFLRRII